MAQHITVVDYDPAWKSMFEREAAALAAILGNNLVSVHHIGSTAVPGLMAKPIVDILPVVADISPVSELYPQFEALGYQCMGEFGIVGRRFFRKGGMERTHHVHLFDESNKMEILRHIAVRDYLRTHSDTARQYGRLKSRLAAMYPHDIDAYCIGKDAFIKDLEQKALEYVKSATAAEIPPL